MEMEQYVTFETAKLLMENGFMEECTRFYTGGDISFMCPCKTCIRIDEVDNSVCVHGYQTVKYM